MKDIGISKFLESIRKKVTDHADRHDAVADVISTQIGYKLTGGDISFKGVDVQLKRIAPAIRTVVALRQEQILQALLEKGFTFRKIV